MTKPTSKKSESWQSIFIKTAIVSAIIIGAGFYFSDRYDSQDDESYGEKLLTVTQIEDASPIDFLELEGNYNKSFWGSEFKIKGKIINKASVADYKDVIVRVTYFSKTKSSIGSMDYTIYEVYPPNSTTPFKLDAENFNDVNSIRCEIVGAVAN